MSVIQLVNVRASHLYCFSPYVGKPSAQVPNPKPTFKSDFLFAPTHPAALLVASEIEKVGSTLQWKGGLTWAAVKENLKATDKLCLKKGDLSIGQPEYAGLLYVKGSNGKMFTILDGDRSPLTERDGRPYSGCYVNAIVDIWAMDNNYGRRINATITGIQFVRHGDAFGGGARAASPEEFGVVAADSADMPTPGAAANPMDGLV